ncbi:hypothetical protein SBADM41S_10611 [Streptomyces badius]
MPLGVPGVSEIPLFDEDFVLVMEQDHWLGGLAPTSRATRCGSCRCSSWTRATACATRPSTSAGRPGRTEGAPVTTTAAGLSTLVQLVAGGLGVTLLPRTAVTVETARNDALATGYFAHPAPTRRVALAMRTGVLGAGRRVRGVRRSAARGDGAAAGTSRMSGRAGAGRRVPPAAPARSRCSRYSVRSPSGRISRHSEGSDNAVTST